MSVPPKRGKNEPPVRPIIVRKVVQAPHGAHHGGAWKVAYADFVTAMMAFFLLMWLLGATTEKQRKSIADYFSPTLVEMRAASSGSDGIFGGDSIESRDNYLSRANGIGTRSLALPQDVASGKAAGADPKLADRKRFEDLKRALQVRIDSKPGLKRLVKNIRFTETREGLRIDIVDEADFAMFATATDRLSPDARDLIAEVAKVAADLPNDLIVRGHTDALPYAAMGPMNNWLLSTARAEATRQALLNAGVAGPRFARIEGVADREPYVPGDRLDPRNRRMSITLGWTG
ncbi:MAG: flagellar motor protein MotB [Sphingomonadales bacterium]|nr:flagellar motor protein MotB [Sphingomonadales bacterium]